MPGSPASGATASSPRQPNGNSMATKTRRSAALSAAFNNGPTQVASGGVSEGSSARSPPSRSGISRGASVGTIVNPAATVSELMAKSPSIKQPSDRPAPSSLSPANSFKVGSGAGATSPPPSTNVGRPSASSQPREHTSGSMKKNPADRSAGSALTDFEASHTNGTSNAPRSNVGHGIVDLNMQRAAILQIAFATIALILFLTLWVYLIVAAGCYRKPMWDFLMKCFSMAGAISSLFVIFNSCFDRQVTSRGVYGCIIFFFITIVVFVNILIGFFAMNCICKCPPDTNAYSEGSTPDLIIFALSIAGSFCLIIVLLVASVAHN